MQYVGFSKEKCREMLYWLACAKACDANYPRSEATGLPLQISCYSRFAARQGRDSIVWKSYGETTCEHAKTLNMGYCNAIKVVGNSNLAVALGNGKALCMS
mmetsp:Transcript_16878/g.20826  ORF Transcript_16878/g.20826 Transcript_16878/m.20826 type:complete len:101 (+) Transcript_16878:12-314(+)